jgi:hypothetical protein
MLLSCSGLHLWEYTFDLETGKATQRRVINDNPYTFEFPTVSTIDRIAQCIACS